MKTIITALDDPSLNNELKKENTYRILCKDIQYQDGVLEILEKYKKIDFLILSELLPGKYKVEELINIIKQKNNISKIIIILESKKEEIENLLYSKGIYKIYYNNEIEIKEIINIIKNEKENNLIIKDELDKIKKILKKNNINIKYENEEIDNKEYIKNLIINKIKKIKLINKLNIKKYNKKDINNNGKIISILGTGGIGKSITTINIANYLSKEKNKILIIDFDVLNSSLHTILGVNQYPKKINNLKKNSSYNKEKINIDNLIININNNIDLISCINLLFDNKYKIKSEKIKIILNELRKKYNYIIIDNSAEYFLDYTKNIIKNSNYSIFLLEANFLEIKKSKNILKLYNKKWNIKKDKIKLLINKYNKNSLDEKIIKNIFKDYIFLGKINYNEKYNLIINENYNNFFQIKKLIKEYKILNDHLKMM